MTFTYRYRKQIIIIIMVVVLLIGITSFTIYKILNNNKKDDIVVEDKLQEKKEVKKEELLKVDIKGQVISPGIYEMGLNSRVIDVIESAGGLTEDADTSVINLSKKITDEMVIIIYSKRQVEEFSKTKEIEKQVAKKCMDNEEYSITNDACIKVNENKSIGKININTATKEDLMTLQGIGESKANDIIKYRDENGGYQNIEDIKKVNGIGENLFASIKENITTW